MRLIISTVISITQELCASIACLVRKEKDRPEGRSEISPAVTVVMMPAMMMVPMMMHARHDDHMRPNVMMMVSAHMMMPTTVVMPVLDLHRVGADLGL